MGQQRKLQASLSGEWRLVRRFWPQIRRQWLLIAGSFLALLAETALRLLEPWPLKFVFDGVIVAGESGIGALDALDPTALLILAAVAVVVIAGLRASAVYIKTVGFALAGIRITTELRGLLYRHLQRLSLSYHARARSGDLVTRITGDIGRLQEVTVRAAMPLAGSVLMLVGTLGVVLWLNWELAVIAIAALPLSMLSMARFTGRIHTIARKQRKQQGAMAANAAESLGAIKIVQAFSLEAVFERGFARQNKKDLREAVKARRLMAGLERNVDIVLAVSTAVVWS